LIGGADDDVIIGGNGKDLIYGDTTDPDLHGAGNDNIQGGADDDTILGGGGNDRIEGNDNADKVSGGDGNDLIWGDNADGQPAQGEASDTISGGDGDDTISGGEDDDVVTGDAGNDEIYGDSGNDTLAGNDGDDVIRGGDGDDDIHGNDGDDALYGDAGNDAMAGGVGNDTLDGGVGDDVMDGGNGHDRMIGGSGNDTIDGGSGADYMDGGDGDDLVYGNSGHDILYGDAGQITGGQDTLLGGLGDDQLNGGKDSDVLIADQGNDTLTGGADNDDFVFGHEIWDQGQLSTNTDIGNNVITDFDDDNGDRIVFHIAFLGTLSASVQGDDVLIESSLGGSVLVEGLVSEVEGITPGDPFFNESALIDFLQKTGTYEADDGKGIIFFEDVHVELPHFDVEQAEVEFEAERPVHDGPKTFLVGDTHVGNTSTFTTPQVIAGLFSDDTANVVFQGDSFLVDKAASNPPTVEATQPVDIIEDADATVQMISDKGVISFDDIDETDTIAISFVPANPPLWSGGLLDPGLATALVDGFSIVEVSDIDPPSTTTWNYDTTVDLDFLRAGETITFDYGVIATDSEGTQTTTPVEFTIIGTNDRPVAEDVFLEVGEDDAFDTVQDSRFQMLTGDGITGAFVGSDVDVNDTLTFEIISDPMDEFGNQYGEVVNNNDGTFTFNPTDEFQFLAAGETRTVTFDYVAIDDSGVGEMPTPPNESDTSAPATISVTVEGADDAPIEFVDELLFTTENQSMFGTGAALVLQPELPFFGLDESTSLDAVLWQQTSLTGGALEDIYNGLAVVAEAIAETACTVFTFGLADCDVDLPEEITVPGLSFEGDLDAKIGLQPYFFLTSGDVDSEIPVDVYFDLPRQVENGETFQISTMYSVDGGATFNTMSPNVNFGMDFVFDLDTDLRALVTSSTFGPGFGIPIWDFDTGNIPGFTGERGEPGFNVFDFSGEDLETEIDLAGFGTFALNFPVINTEGTPDPVGSNTLTSEGEDDVAVLDLDIDAMVAQLIELGTGVPITFGESGSLVDLSIPILGESVNLFSVDYSWDVIAVNLITTLKVLQEFALEVQDLPLVATLEDDSEITGFSLGDEITINTPDDSVFDADIHGDMDGLIDFDIAVDMDAIFSNLTTLGLDLDLFAGVLQLSGGISSVFFDGPTFSLFDAGQIDGPGGDVDLALIPSVDGNDDGFLFGETFSLLSDVELATLFEEEFPIEGWNTAANNTDLFFDVA
jgi:hypothetical protein